MQSPSLLALQSRFRVRGARGRPHGVMDFGRNELIKAKLERGLSAAASASLAGMPADHACDAAARPTVRGTGECDRARA
eukprot:6203942-Pleurochrysis_carterae.AAC.1